MSPKHQFTITKLLVDRSLGNSGLHRNKKFVICIEPQQLCHTSGGKGHFKRECPNRKVMIVSNGNEYENGALVHMLLMTMIILVRVAWFLLLLQHLLFFSRSVH
jgi:hypothetical protein